MPIKQLDIHGYRGFSVKGTLTPAVPNGTPGSGLTLLVGANNAGKSTVAEAMRFFSVGQPPSISEGRRNKKAGDAVDIRLVEADGHFRHIRTLHGGSETELIQTPGQQHPPLRLHGLPSRRYFQAYFGGRHEVRREDFAANTAHLPRGQVINDFANRLVLVQKNRAAFDAVLAKVVNPVPKWTVEQSDQGSWYIKLDTGSAFHNSEGLGEGLISLLFIVDALYDSKPGDVIVIDEPELSLHPSLLRRLADLLVEYSADRQIICATHSPYFVTLDSLNGGVVIARVFLETDSCKIAHLSDASAKALAKLATDANNPHVFGLDAREVFFLPDGVVLVEGQEDVIGYKDICASLGKNFKGSFYGWGVGGADKMRLIAAALRDLGYQRVVGIVDGDKKNVADSLNKEFPGYRFFVIPAVDVRTKPARKASEEKVGLLDQNRAVRPEHIAAIDKLIEAANKVLG